MADEELSPSMPQGRLAPEDEPAAAPGAGAETLDEILDIDIGPSAAGSQDEGVPDVSGDDMEPIAEYEGVGESLPNALMAPMTPVSSWFRHSPATPSSLPRRAFSPLLHPRPHGPALSDRRPSAASSHSAHTDRSHASHRNDNAANVFSDIYLANPEMPRWDESQDDAEYHPWTREMEDLVRTLADKVTDPPHEGMLFKVDRFGVIQAHIDTGSRAVKDAFALLLHAYDIAMSGKVAALLALGGAQSKIYQQKEHATVADVAIRDVREKNEELYRAVEVLETEKREQDRQIVVLQEQTHTLAADKAKLEAKCAEVSSARQTELDVLQDMVNEWEPLPQPESVPPSSPASSGRGEDSDARFQSIRAALEEAQASAAISSARCRELEDRCNALEKALQEAGKQPLPQEPSFSGKSSVDSRGSEPERRNLALEMQHEAEQAHSEEERDKDSGNLIASWPDKCAALERTIEELKKKLAEQLVEAAREREGYKNGIDGVEADVNDLYAKVTRGLARLEHDSGPAPSPDDVPQSLLPIEVIRDIGAAQLKAMQDSRAAMDALKAHIDDIVARITKEIADDNAANSKEMQELAEELKKLSTEAEAWDEERAAMVEREASLQRELELVQAELETLRQQVRTDRQSFQEIEQQVRRQSAKVEAAKTPSQRNAKPQVSPLTSLGSYRSFRESGEITFGASADEMEYLQGASFLIERLWANLHQMAAKDALRQCIDELHILHDGLRSLEPDTPTEDLLIALGSFLEDTLDSGTEIDPRESVDFAAELFQHDAYLKGLLELEQYTSRQSDSERDLLQGLERKIDAVGDIQHKQTQLLEEYEAYREKHAHRPLGWRQSSKLLRLVSSFVEKNGDAWALRGPTGAEGAAAMVPLIAKIQQLTADAFVMEKRRQLQEGIRSQEIPLAELREENPRIIRLVDLCQRQLDAFHRLQNRPGKAESKVDDRWKAAIEASIKRRESRLRQKFDFNEAFIDRLDARKAQVQAFLDSEAVSDHHRAEQLLGETLLTIQASAPPSGHGEGACFCTLLRYLFPSAYYSTIKGGCCAGGKEVASATQPVPSQGVAPSCQGHHGHGSWFFSPARRWAPVCRILTSLTWMFLLILMQPANMFTTAVSLISILLDLPAYLYRLASYTVSRFRRRRLRASSSDPEGPPPTSEDDTPLPTLDLPQTPPASAIVGTAVSLFLAYAWLSYMAVLIERQIWVGNTDWRYAYVADLTTAAKSAPTYPEWSPVRVDYRLVTQPLRVWFWEGVHSFFGWERAVDLQGGIYNRHGGLMGAVGKNVGGVTGYGVKVGNVSSY